MKHRFFQVLIIVVIVSGAVLLYNHTSTHAASPQPLSVTITSTPPVALPGQSIIVTITSTNTQAQEIKDVILKDIIPPGAVYIKKLSGIDPVFDGKTLTWKIPSIPPNNSNIIQFQAKVMTDPISIFVAPNGNNSTGTGTIDKPYLTIERARDNIRTLKQQEALTAPTTINIKSGTYGLDKSLDFTTYDSGTNNTPITYQGYGGEVKVTGSKKITSAWTKCSDGDANCNGLIASAKGNTYYSNLKTDPYFKDHQDQLQFNSLFVNDARATRARTPNVNTNAADSFYNVLDNPANIGYNTQNVPYRIEKPGVPSGEACKIAAPTGAEIEACNYKKFFNFGNIKTSAGADTGIPQINQSWKNLKDVQVVSLIRFLSTRSNIAEVTSSYKYPASFKDTNSYHRVKVQGAASWPYDWDYSFSYPGDSAQKNSRFYLDNVFEGLDTAGEWYLDKTSGNSTSGLLYYQPKSGENINTVSINAPITTQLVKMTGLPDNYKDFTVSQWLKTTDKTNKIAIIAQNNSFQTRLYNGNASLLIGIDKFTDPHNPNDKPIDTVDCGSTNISDGNWHMLAGVYNRSGKKLSCYIDGVFKAEKVLDKNYFGGDMQTPPFVGVNYTGAMDDLKTYNRALTGGEISDIYNNKPISQGLIASLSFDNNLTDSVGNYAWKQVGVEEAAGTPSFQASGHSGQFLNFDGTQRLEIDWGALRANHPDNFVQYLNFRNFKFQDTDTLTLATGNWAYQAAYKTAVPPAIFIQNGSHIGISNCNISHTGGFGLRALYSDNMTISHNLFDDLGAGAILIGEDSTSDAFYSKDNVVSDNSIQNFGLVDPEAAGIVSLKTANTTISHNEVKNGTYSGMSIGWFSSNDIGQNNNTIEYNHIHNVAQLMNDAGGIYTYGLQKSTVIKNNLIHDVIKTPMHISDTLHTNIYGIYLDNATEGVTVKDNILYNNQISFFINSLAKYDIVKNNIFVNGLDWQLRYIAPENLTFTNNVILYNKPQANLIYGSSYYKGPSSDGSGKEYFTLPTLIQNNNLYYNQNNSYIFELSDKTTKVSTFDQWKALGFDKDTITADPQFTDPANNNYALKSTSPALKPISQGGIGFKQIDMSTVGPR